MILVEFVWRIRSLGLSHQTVSDPGFLTGLILYPSFFVFLKPASLWTYELDLGGSLVFSRLFPLSKNNFLIGSPILAFHLDFTFLCSVSLNTRTQAFTQLIIWIIMRWCVL